MVTSIVSKRFWLHRHARPRAQASGHTESVRQMCRDLGRDKLLTRSLSMVDHVIRLNSTILFLWNICIDYTHYQKIIKVHQTEHLVYFISLSRLVFTQAWSKGIRSVANTPYRYTWQNRPIIFTVYLLVFPRHLAVLLTHEMQDSSIVGQSSKIKHPEEMCS